MRDQQAIHRPASRRNMRMVAAASVVLCFAALHVLGTKEVAVGLFPSPWDKLAHVMTFALIGGAFGLATGTQGWRRAVCCIAGAVLAGVLDEWHQAFLPGRHASWMDLLADTAGGVLAAALLRLKCWLAHRRTSHR
jgi:VanZ family protein